MNRSKLIEMMADEVHQVWCNWMKYMFSQGYPRGTTHPMGSWVMPPEKFDRWYSQMITPYAQLTEKEKESDRKIAERYLDLLAIMTDEEE